MAREASEPRQELQLPLGIIGHAEVNKAIRELGRLDDYFVAAAAEGQPQLQAKFSHALDELAKLNRINLLEAVQRKWLRAELEGVLARAPSMQISFASEPSPRVMEKILSWFREQVHPRTLIQVGLEPTIGAGCILRTPNQVFDMSLGARLHDQEDYLAKLIGDARR